MLRVAIVGGGPGGLLTAYLLEQKYSACHSTILEATDRVGGKIHTGRFDSEPIIYEAGLAELYAYNMIGPDPLRRLVRQLGLETVPMNGRTVVMDSKILRHNADIARHCGRPTLQAIERFRRRAAEAMPLTDWYESSWHRENRHPWARRSCEAILDEIPDPTARKYLKVAVRSDLATEPHLTNGLNGLKNFLMDVPGYIRLYSIAGGLERLPRELRARLTATEFVLDSPVVAVEQSSNGTYRVHYRRGQCIESSEFDAVFVALPHNWLGTIEWRGERLRKAMARHRARYDHPAHYLRVSVLFARPFWRSMIADSWFILDAFGGCCVYDEGARYGAGERGVLGWLLAGADALSLSNLDDRALVEAALGSLPSPLCADARATFVEGKVHRWVAAVNALPGGFPMQDTRSAHLPEPKEHPGVLMVGDYLFDSTLNGLLDSADFATDLVHSWILRRQLQGRAVIDVLAAAPAALPAPPYAALPAARNGPKPANSPLRTRVDANYFDHYFGGEPYEAAFATHFDAALVTRQIDVVWRHRPPYRLLDSGSATGLTLAQFSARGVDAWGIESSRYAHARTPARLRRRNILADVRRLPFPDNHFDFVYETALCHVPERHLGRAVSELHRVTRRGLILATVTSDIDADLFVKHNLLSGVRTLMTLYEWSELFTRYGFAIEIKNDGTASRILKHWRLLKQRVSQWYPDEDSVRYCYYTKVNAVREPAWVARESTGLSLSRW